MRTEYIVAISFLAGGLAGIAITAWVVFYPLPYWSDDAHFANFSKSCIFTDMGATYQVYCPRLNIHS
jgi:hypothetical protein